MKQPDAWESGCRTRWGEYFVEIVCRNEGVRQPRDTAIAHRTGDWYVRVFNGDHTPRAEVSGLRNQHDAAQGLASGKLTFLAPIPLDYEGWEPGLWEFKWAEQ